MTAPHPRRFRFGVEMMGPLPSMTWAQSARELERLGYTTLFVPDHFHEGFGPITAMATAAAATTTLIVAPMVLACDFRQGGPPILIAGGGRRMLEFAAVHADIIGVNPSLSGAPNTRTALDALPSAIDHKFELIRSSACDRFDQLEFNAWISTAAITDDLSELSRRLGAQFGAEPDEALQSPIVLAGSVNQVVDQLVRRRERWGYSYTVLQSDQVHAFGPVVEQLAGQ